MSAINGKLYADKTKISGDGATMKKRLLSIFLILAMVLCFVPMTVMAKDSTGDFTVTGGTLGTDYTYEDHVLKIVSDTPLTISGTTVSDRIEVALGVNANITLAGVSIDVSQKDDTPAFTISGDNRGVSTGNVTITIADNTTNVLKSGSYWAGLTKWNGNGSSHTKGGWLKIQGGTNGTGKLEATGGSYGAGIGGSWGFHSCDIYIYSGNVIATGGSDGAGIGGGLTRNGTNINISGGTVTAIGGSDSAGIGGGNDGATSDIKITGGSVKTSSIGCTPTNGTESVYPITIANPDGKDVYINDTTPYVPSNHSAVSGDTNLYVYLPAKTIQDANVVTVGAKTTKYCFDTNNSKWINVVDVPAADSRTYTYTGASQTYQIADSDYYTVSGNVQTNVDKYMVTVALNDTTNTVWNDGTTDNKEYNFTIEKAVASTIPDINKSYNRGVTGEQTVTVSGLPEGMGVIGSITAEITSDENKILAANSASFDEESGEVSYTLNTNNKEKIGSTANIKVTVPSQNYEPITFNVIVTITDKNTRTDKPDCTLTFSYDNNNNCTATITAVDGAEYSFDGTNWSDTNTKAVTHGEIVTGYIRYKETDDDNASEFNSDRKTVGHETLPHTSAKAPNTAEAGNKEYWYCNICNKYFSDENGTSEIIDGVVIPKLPVITKGNRQTVTIGEKKTLAFTSDADYADFRHVLMDGKELDAANYTVKSGSTIVTLNADYVATLSVGDHTLSIVSENGTATAKFTVNEKVAETTTATDTPTTGDNSTIFIWLALLLLSGGTATIATLTSKKRKYNR